jgi:hypothetical protein
MLKSDINCNRLVLQQEDEQGRSTLVGELKTRAGLFKKLKSILALNQLDFTEGEKAKIDLT